MSGRDSCRERTNFYQMIPIQNIKWEKDEKGMIVLLKPKFKNLFLARYILPRLKNPYFRIKLDKIGSFIWSQCNGERTVKELADNLEKKFGEEVKPVSERLTLFLQKLEKNCFIIYR